MDLKSIIRTVAPGLAGLLGGPLAATVVSFLGEKLLSDKNATPADIIAAVNDPDTLIKLKELDTQISLAQISKDAQINALESSQVNKQLDINLTEAGKESFFISGARPSILWLGTIILFFNYILYPILHVFYPQLIPLNGSEIMPIILGLLGLGGMRSYDKATIVKHRNS